MNPHIAQFGRGLWRLTLVVLGCATLPIWFIPYIIYKFGDDTPEPLGMW